MESNSDEMEKMKEPFLDTNQDSSKGGFRTLPFIIANEAAERLGTCGLTANMILYMRNEYKMEMVTGNNILNLWISATNFLPVVGAFLSDSFVGRYPMIGLGSILSLLGIIMLWSTTLIPHARPSTCIESSSSCSSSTAIKVSYLCCSIVIMSIGSGGIRSSSMAFGTDQLKLRDSLKKSVPLESYFGCTHVSLSFFILLGFSLLRQESTTMVYHHRKGSALLVPSDKLRFLNKACIIRCPQQYSSADEIHLDSWKVCTVDQVEELKAVIKVIPLWSTGAILAVNVNQPSFPVIQARSMDRHLTSWFEIPAGSFAVFMSLVFILWVGIYDSIILPLASWIMKKPVCLSPKQRMGIGIFVSIFPPATMAIIEYFRRNMVINEGLSADPDAVVKMSAMWLLLPNCLNGLAEALNIIAQNEFYFSEFPRSMSCIALTLRGLGMSAGGLLATFIISSVDKISTSGGNMSWVPSNINEGHYDYYYWVLAGISAGNFVYFLLCSCAYGPEAEGGEVNFTEVVD
ncbi:Major facilitator superfamily protein [Heracleum sosnowskyi]|uniref:Major facilitator superfamily protein n=1 Tax=Heracleum sosnowskyi TaxID=360622 RepID=A0AAD8MK56_9APIA|nr:Major facilitator superfamily protein [Heracleum sosnowskyi]